MTNHQKTLEGEANARFVFVPRYVKYIIPVLQTVIAATGVALLAFFFL